MPQPIMTGEKYSALPAITAPLGTDVFGIVQSGVSKKITAAQMMSNAFPSFAKASFPTSFTAGKIIHASDAEGGLWLDNGSKFVKIIPSINILDAPFNADESGLTDSKDAFNAAAAIVGPKRIVIPAGVYYFSGPVLWTDDTIIDADTNAIFIRGWASTTEGIFDAVFRNADFVNGNSNISMYGGQFNVDGNLTGMPIAFRRCNKIRLTNVTLADYYNSWGFVFFDTNNIVAQGLYAETSNQGQHEDGFHVEGGRYIELANSIFFSGDDSIVGGQEGPNGSYEAEDDILDWNISNCYASSALANGLRLQCTFGTTVPTRAIRRVNVNNLIIKGGSANPGGGGINISDEVLSGKISDITLSDTYVDASRSTDIAVRIFVASNVTLKNVHVNDHFNNAFDLDGITHLVLDDCDSFAGANTQAGAHSIALAQLASCVDVTIKGGKYKQATSHGLLLGSAGFTVEALKLIGANVRDTGGVGAKFTNIYLGGQVALNNINGCNGGGAIIAADCVGLQFVYNDVSGNNTLSYSNLSTSTILRGNKVARTAGAISEGKAILVAGEVTVNTEEVETTDRIVLTRGLLGGTPGWIYYLPADISAGVHFKIKSTSATDTSEVYWWIIH